VHEIFRRIYYEFLYINLSCILVTKHEELLRFIGFHFCTRILSDSFLLFPFDRFSISLNTGNQVDILGEITWYFFSSFWQEYILLRTMLELRYKNTGTVKYMYRGWGTNPNALRRDSRDCNLSMFTHYINPVFSSRKLRRENQLYSRSPVYEKIH
jgi:hypothetical protein